MRALAKGRRSAEKFLGQFRVRAESFLDRFRFGRYIPLSSGYQYPTPRYLVVGPIGSGKTSLVSALALPKPDEVGKVVRLPAACECHAFKQGQLVDASGILFLGGDLTNDPVNWSRLLECLRRSREMRPIDGVVLTLSAADLLAWERRSLSELKSIGDGLADRLREAAAHLGVSLPVYVLLTHSDQLSGFAAVQAQVPGPRKQEMIGWSSPYARDTNFSGDWIEQAMESVAARLTVITTEILADWDRPESALPIIRAPEEIRHLSLAARVILSQVFETEAEVPPVFLRGIYFCGQESTWPGESPGSSPEPPVAFIEELFTTKIFPERGLARSLDQRAREKMRAVWLMRVAAVILLFIGLPAMWRADKELGRRVAPLSAVLDSLSYEIPTDYDTYGHERRLRHLLTGVGMLEAKPMRSILIPSSYLSEGNTRLWEALVSEAETTLLPSLRTGLVEWPDTLVSFQWATTLGGRVPLDDPQDLAGSIDRNQEYEVLIRYLSELRQWVDATHLYNDMASGGGAGAQSMERLYRWYFELEMPPDAAGVFLASATSLPLMSPEEWPGVEIGTAETAAFLVERLFRKMIGSLSGVEQGLASLTDPRTGVGDLRRLWLDVQNVDALVLSADSAWLDLARPMVPALVLMLDSLPDSEMFDRREFRDRFTAAFQEIRMEVLGELRLDRLERSLGPEMWPSLRGLQAGLTELLGASFMTPVPASPFPQSMMVGIRTWNVLPLQEGVDQFAEYRSLREGRLNGVPATLTLPLLSVAERALEDHVRSTLARAMTLETAVVASGRAGHEQEVTARLESFNLAAPYLIQMLDIDAGGGGSPAGSAVAEVIVLEALDLLAALDDLLEEERLYDPANGDLAVWSGNGPASFAGFSVRDAAGLEDHLRRQRLRLSWFSEQATPLLAYLALPPVNEVFQTAGRALNPEGHGLAIRWGEIGETLDEFDRVVPGNSLASLHQYIRDDMSISSSADCSRVNPTAVPRTDYFTSVRNRLNTLLVQRCEALQR